MSWFRRTEAVRTVAIPIANSDLVQYEQPSLFIAGRLSRQHSHQFDELVVAPFGLIDEVGFAVRWADPLSSLPPRDPRFHRDFYQDRFLAARLGECGSCLARLEINEALIEDTYMRGSIDYTGFGMTVTFRADAYAVFAEVMEIEKPGTMFDHRGFVLGMPTPPFAFPAQRGSPKPGDAKIEYAKNLQPIKRLEVSEMSVAIVNRRWPSGGDSILDRFEILSATRLTLAPR